jgi:hypothetical protein
MPPGWPGSCPKLEIHWHISELSDSPTPHECLSDVSDVADAAVSNLDELRNPVTGVKLCGIAPSVGERSRDDYRVQDDIG